MSTQYGSPSRTFKTSPPLASSMLPPPTQLSSSYPPPNIFYASEPSSHLYPPPMEHDRQRPPIGLTLPHPPSFHQDDYTLPFTYVAHGQQHFGAQSPYETPNGYHPGSADSAGSATMTEYFPPYGTNSTPNHLPPMGYATPSPTYPLPPHSRPHPPAGSSRTANHGVGGKTGRQQFSACGACRHRRVKCDLKEKQDALEGGGSDDAKGGPIRGSAKARKKAICTNCEERGVACVDEYAPIKAAKQLRRGKRITEIEVLYGKSATAALTTNPDGDVKRALIKGKPAIPGVLPELTQSFFESAFFRRFQVQRPVLDSRDFSQRYLSAPKPCAAAMGPEGAILCHVLYAWALSYGVDENGQLDVPEGGGDVLGPLPLSNPSENELRREADRQRRFQRMKNAVDVILKEVDEQGVMRKPTWDGVRVLLLVLPLTEGISSSVERLSMYETALNQVYSLCSFAGVGYDGQPAGTSGVNGGSDEDGRQNVQLVRVRIYWYAFVHEGITTGLKGGRLLLDDEDLETMQDSIHNRALVRSNSTYQTTVKFATAPINLALACRLINRALTGPSARRAKSVNGVWVKEAWEALEKSWEEFEALKYAPDAPSLYSSMDEVIRFADGWKIFLFEAQNVIRKILEERYAKLSATRDEAYISDGALDGSPESHERTTELVNLQRLVDISKSKCEVKCRQILEMVRRHVGTRFFEWDASLVRDGTFYAAKLLPRLGGVGDDIAVCLQALNELRWAHAKALDRSAELRGEWAESRSNPSPLRVDVTGWDGSYSGQAVHSATQESGFHSYDSNHSLSASDSPFHSPGFNNGSAFLPHPADHHAQYHGVPLDPSSIPRGVGMDMSKMQWTTPHGAQMDGSIAPSSATQGMLGVPSGYAVYGHMPGPPPLGGSAGIMGMSGAGHGGGGGYRDESDGYGGYRN